MESKYMTLEEYAATLKVGDEVTIEYYSISGDRQTVVNEPDSEPIIYLR